MTREVTFDEERVNEWKDEYQYSEDTVGIFDYETVPGMMLISEVTPVVSSLFDEDETAILSGITAARFRDPVIVGETVTISAEIVEEDKRFTAVDYEMRVEARGSLVANGVLNVVVK